MVGIVDSVLRQLLGRVGMHLQQELDFVVDTQRFGSDAEYAAQVLDLASELGNYELKTLCKEVRERKLALLSLNNVTASDNAAPTALPPGEGSGPGKRV
jgi:hypothetical protein